MSHIGIDIGASATKVVVLDEGKIIFKYIIGMGRDNISIGAIMDEIKKQIDISLIAEICVTGVGASYIDKKFSGLELKVVSEFEASGKGALYLSKLNHAIVVSMGTGTAILEAKANEIKHIIGTGVGGGALLGLGNILVQSKDFQYLSKLSEAGSLEGVDLTIGDITNKTIPGLKPDTTASNFGKVADNLSNEDKMKGLCNMICQSLCTMGILAAKGAKISDIILIGQLTKVKQLLEVTEIFSNLYSVNFYIPDDAGFATAIGACLLGFGKYSQKDGGLL